MVTETSYKMQYKQEHLFRFRLLLSLHFVFYFHMSVTPGTSLARFCPRMYKNRVNFSLLSSLSLYSLLSILVDSQ